MRVEKFQPVRAAPRNQRLFRDEAPTRPLTCNRANSTAPPQRYSGEGEDIGGGGGRRGLPNEKEEEVSNNKGTEQQDGEVA